MFWRVLKKLKHHKSENLDLRPREKILKETEHYPPKNMLKDRQETGGLRWVDALGAYIDLSKKKKKKNTNIV